MYSWVCLLVCLLHAAAHPCDSEVQSACPERASSELARCLKDKSEHESPTDISSECADFIALNAACADDIIKSCDEAFFTEDTALCLSTWTAREDLTPKCAGVLSWALPKQEAADGDGPNDELGMSEKDYAEKQEWRAKRRAGRSAAIEKIRQDREQEKELEALKKEDPVAYKQLMKEREEAEKSFEELKKRRRLIAAAEERKRRKELGLPELEASSEEEEEARRQKRIEERLEVIREAKKKERVNWLPYVLGGLFVAYIFFNVLNMFGGKKKDDNDEDDKDD